MNTLHILNSTFYNLSGFKSSFWTSVTFWLEYFITRQILDWENFQPVMFSIKNFSSCQIFEKCLQSKYHVLFHFNPWKRHALQFICWFEKHDFELKFSLLVRFQIEKEVQLVRVQKKKNTTGQISSWDFPNCQILHQLLNAPQILNWTFFNVSGLNKLSEHAPEFHMKFLLRVRFRIGKKYIMSESETRKNQRVFSLSLKNTTIRIRAKIFQRVRFYINLQIRFRFWIENITTCQILNQLPEKASNFELKFLKSIKFWIEKNFNALCFEIKIFRHVRFWKKVCNQIITFWFILIHEDAMYCNSCAVLKSTIFNWKIYHVFDFVLNRIQLVRLGNKRITSRVFLSLKTTKRQISSWKSFKLSVSIPIFNHASDFDLNILQRLRF